MPFAPGRAQGRVVRDPAQATDKTVLLVAQAHLADVRLRPAALLVSGGAPFSHSMIRLLALGVPVVIISPAAATELPEGADVAVDGVSGYILAADRNLAPLAAPPAAPRSGSPVLSADGQPVALRASVADAAGAARALGQGAAGIGLVRSEFIQPASGERPDAAFYLGAFRELCEAARPLPVTVRLIDIAADKHPAWLAPVAGMQGALGLQGIRLYDLDPVREVVHAQLDAVARLAPDFELSLLLPYVVRVEEFWQWRTEIEGALPAPLAVGSMIETPAAALAIPEILACADFVALGCNDLMQCLFAADRDIPEVAPVLDPYAPVLFRFLSQTIAAAGDQAERIQVCGLLAQLPGILPILLGMGYRTFSVEPFLIPWLAQTVSATDTSEAGLLAAAACAAADSDTVRTLVALGSPPAANAGQSGLE
jgi:phosphoenolpyruvate-protein kinase (PTS system EI component)